MNYKFLIAILMLSLFQTGCSITGLSGSRDDHTCPAPVDGVCVTVSDAYEYSVSGSSPGGNSGLTVDRALDGGAGAMMEAGTRGEDSSSASRESEPKGQVNRSGRILRQAIPASGTAIRSAPRVVRLWIAPWEDGDGDLHDQMYVFLTLDTGRWLIEHKRSKIRSEFAPTTLRSSGAQSTEPKTSTQSTSKPSSAGFAAKP